MSRKIEMKPPLTYYGGKQLMLKNILPILPEHKIYNEPFFGGGAVFFAKEPAKIEFINDVSGEIVNFYRVIKREFEALKGEIDCTLHSEFQHKQARDIYMNHTDPDKVMRAWAVFVLSHQSMFASLTNTWKVSKDRNIANQFMTKKQMFDERYIKRLDSTSIFCRDALRVIKAADTEETFHYIDPPYYNADMGHYDGYTKQDFINLLELLKVVKGKFLLSSYPSDILTEHTKDSGWIQFELDLPKSSGNGSRKTEVLTMNYEPTADQLKEAFIL